MQHSVVPELAHTRSNPMHWLATAAALAAVVAASAFVQPDDATAAQAGPPAVTAQAAPDPAAARIPMNCPGEGPQILQHASGDLDKDGRPETVAVARCAAGSGTPPSGVYVITQPAAGKPRVVATLVDPKDRLSVTDFAVTNGVVTATLLGYSSPSVPRCCPDETEKAKWHWQDSTFVRSEQSAAVGV
ncbi:hypothetical protein [Streptomyces indicus]|uniref:Secreted protein n=1 Tax=Streptomyces indicus TaxID=417292 RepID=A0A1G8XP15_9ACTN|nr:hypothetical protein [Streptomyces indicus]SDJ92321.1 hypothetical protein SAMN05421806_103324 [Streptomyces indicus]